MSILRYCITDSPNDFTFSEFYILNLGISEFNGNAHIMNFGKYLASMSKGHPKVSETSRNLFIKEFEDINLNEEKEIIYDNKEFFNKYAKFNRVYNYEIANDLHYFYFNIINKEKKTIISNLFSNTLAEIEEVEEELLEFGEARGLNTESLASLYAYAKKNEFTFINFSENYEKISKEDIEYIEFKTREIISLISPEIVYFSVSHSDQDSFHIHRIIKK